MGKHGQEKRTERIVTSVSPAEKQRIENILPQTVYGSMSEFIRDYILKCVAVLEDNTKQLVYFEVTPIDE